MNTLLHFNSQTSVHTHAHRSAPQCGAGWRGVLPRNPMEYVDYRRYADGVRPTGSYAIDGARGGTRRGLALAQGTALAIATPAPKTAAGAGEDADAELPTSKRLPVWWLFFLPLYWFPQGINFGLIQTVSRLPPAKIE